MEAAACDGAHPEGRAERGICDILVAGNDLRLRKALFV